MDSLVERKDDLRGYIVGNGDGTAWRYWVDGMPNWTPHSDEATRFARRSDAEDVHAEDEDAWCIVEYKDVATPSARITGDKDRGSPVEGAPYGEGLIGRIDTLEVKNAELRRALAYAQGEQLRLMQERHELERQLKIAREGLMEVTDYGDLQAVRIARQALANMEQADD